ncbi:hypothetical protein HYR53_04330 [Candidatus Acetothermia bacterium]|nr:hypothetical protein [Candidatus Acetothermia bacterium]
MKRILIFSLLSLLFIHLSALAQALDETTQILVNWSAEEGHIFKLSFKEATRYDAWRIQFGDGQEALIASPNTPATHFYREPGDYVVIVTIYLPDEKPIQIQKPISITPLGSPIDRAIAQAKSFALQAGTALLAIFLLLKELGVIA